MSRPLRRRSAVALTIAAVALGWLPSGTPLAEGDEVKGGRVAAAGGRPLLAEALVAPVVVVGVVHEPLALDDVAWLADLEVEKTLRGDPQPGSRLAIAWEELARDRPRRFDDGGRIVVALEPVPSWSIWRKRLEGREAWGVARRGDAFLRDPSGDTVESLSGLLALPEAARAAAPGVAALVGVATRAQPPVAASALEILDATADLASKIGPDSLTALADQIDDTARPAPLRVQTAQLAGRQKLSALRDALVRAGAPESPIAAAALDAQATIDGGLPAAEVASLLARPEPDVRAVALRHAPADLEPDPAVALLTDDPSPEVRCEAARALAKRRGIGAYDLLEKALTSDPDPTVRGTAASVLGGLGSEAASRLAAHVRGRDLDGSREALVALAEAGPPGRAELERIAAGHDDPKVRGFARFLLGRPSEPSH